MSELAHKNAFFHSRSQLPRNIFYYNSHMNITFFAYFATDNGQNAGIFRGQSVLAFFTRFMSNYSPGADCWSY